MGAKLEDLKLQVFHDSFQSKKQDNTFTRSNSIEVVKNQIDPDLTKEENLKEKLNLIFKQKRYNCILCFDDKENLVIAQ